MVHLETTYRSLFFVAIFFSFKVTDANFCSSANLCFALDESWSISRFDFRNMNRSISSIVDEYDQVAPNSFYSAVGFSNDATLISNLTDDLEKFKERISLNVQNVGGTNMLSGLEACDSILSEQAQRLKLIIILSDGKPINPIGVTEAASRIKDQGTSIAAIGVGSSTKLKFLQEIASQPELYTNVANFSTLLLNTTTQSISKDLCLTEPLLSSPIVYVPLGFLLLGVSFLGAAFLSMGCTSKFKFHAKKKRNKIGSTQRY